MNATSWKKYIAGLAVYGTCITLAALPIYPKPLSQLALTQLLSAAAIASVLVAALRMSGLDARLGDRGAYFIQALFGIGVCSGVYGLVSIDPRPDITFLGYLLWTAVGLMNFNPRRVLALYLANLAIYLNTFAGLLFVSADRERYADAMFSLLMTTLMAAFMSWRAADYTRVRREKAQLASENSVNEEKLREAEERIHTLTVQDMDTIALKYPYFKDALAQQKTRADKNGETFSIGLIEIDHFVDIQRNYGEAAAKQLLREFADRVTVLVRKMDFLETSDRTYHPLGRVGDGLFGLILPGANLKGAQYCADILHKAMEFRSIQTSAGPLTLTLSIGVTEYEAGENVDALMEQLSVSLERARLAHEDIYQKASQPKKPQAPLKGASSSNDMRLLDYKDYSRPVH